MIFEFKDYRAYLEERIESSPNQGRGLKSKLATAIGCQPAFISQVLKGLNNISLEQGDKINKFFCHDEMESHYLLLLIQSERAGTVTLKSYFQKQIESNQQEHRKLHVKIKQSNIPEIGLPEQMIYYSDWLFAAVHIISTIPKYRQEIKIASALNVSDEKIRFAVDTLLKMGLLKRENGEIKPTANTIHLPGESPLVGTHHTNWRIKAIEHINSSCSNDLCRDLHYSSVVSIGEKDADLLHKKMAKFIMEIRQTVEKSSEEKLFVFNVDYFSLAKD